MAQPKTEEITRIPLSALEAHRMTLAMERVGQIEMALGEAQGEAGAQIHQVLKRAGVEPGDKPWALAVDGDNVVIRRQS